MHSLPNSELLRCIALVQIEGDFGFEGDGLVDSEMYCFPQVWGSTALGFGGIGGQAITSALTTVFLLEYEDRKTKESAVFGCVFFDEGLAYAIKNPKRRFVEDVRRLQMLPRSESGAYRRAD
jgi:hypothetical protein